MIELAENIMPWRVWWFCTEAQWLTPCSQGLLPGQLSTLGYYLWEPPHAQEGRCVMNRMIVRRLLIKTLRIRKVIKRMRLSVCMKKGRQLLLWCVVSPWLSLVHKLLVINLHCYSYTPYLIFVNFGAPPHLLGLYKGHQKLHIYSWQNSQKWPKWAKIWRFPC